MGTRGCGTCRHYCPCGRLRRIGVPVIEAHVPRGQLGYFDPDTRTVTIRPGLPSAVRRSTLAHEAAHAEVGDAGERTWWGQQHVEEMEACADEIAARALIPLHTLVDSLATAATVEQVADDLAVDVPMVHARMRTFTPAERRYVERRLMGVPLPHPRPDPDVDAGSMSEAGAAVNRR